MKQVCSQCKEVHPVFQGLEEDFYAQGEMGEEKSTMFIANPFAADVHGDLTKAWICSHCFYEARMDI